MLKSLKPPKRRTETRTMSRLRQKMREVQTWVQFEEIIAAVNEDDRGATRTRADAPRRSAVLRAGDVVHGDRETAAARAALPDVEQSEAVHELMNTNTNEVDACKA